VSLPRLLFFLAACAASGVFAWNFHTAYHNNGNAITVVTAAFSILAGFLAAILSIGYVNHIERSKSWREGTIKLTEIKDEMLRYEFLFYAYLFILGLAFISALDLHWPYISATSDFLVLFFSALSLIYSFCLPRYLVNKNLVELTSMLSARQKSETSGNYIESGARGADDK
jgi:hypothetical protein